MSDKEYTDMLVSQAIQVLGRHTETEVTRWKDVAAKMRIALD